MFLPALRIQDLHAMPGFFGQDFLEQLAIFEIHRRMDETRQIGGIEIELLQQRRQKFGGIEFVQVLPVKIAAVHHAPAAQVEQIHGHLRRLGVPCEHVGIVAFGRGDFLRSSISSSVFSRSR